MKTSRFIPTARRWPFSNKLMRALLCRSYTVSMALALPPSTNGALNPAEWTPSLMARLKELEDENRRLKKMYAEERLKAEIVQETLTKKW